jgi:hypothetical protein
MFPLRAHLLSNGSGKFRASLRVCGYPSASAICINVNNLIG